jgi:hypothetical protein
LITKRIEHKVRKLVHVLGVVRIVAIGEAYDDYGANVRSLIPAQLATGLLSTVRSLLFAVCCLLFVACRLLSTVRCLLSDGLRYAMLRLMMTMESMCALLFLLNWRQVNVIRIKLPF